ncbi:hypothetical protein EVJ58_g1638 [Rhodofomes roseus]|uniref:F-box domain-containing protein n=1 Tax=Rhodofomes roseus TaxID=34475 RepID=A0A4Y9Z223_9APHY|nr:hypothetical protein EVJ58_g1638 [Rhodofomes roseus]
MLPAEIQDEIVDQLSGEPRVLKACALTCHHWARRAQRSLFRTVSILHGSHHKRVKSMLKAHPGLAQFVRVLSIGKPDPERAELDVEWPELLLMMDRVEELNVGTLNIFSRGDVRERLKTYFPRVRMLRLLGTHSLQCDDFLQFLAAFRSLSLLHLSDQVQVTPPIGGSMQHLDVPPTTDSTLVSLTLRAASGSTAACLLYYLPLRTLRRLQLKFDKLDSSLDCSGLLRAAAPTVEELVLRLPSYQLLAIILQSPVPFARLRRLHLKDAGLEVSAVDYRYPAWMLSALSHIARWEMRANLREIVLSMPLPGTGPYQRPPEMVELPGAFADFPFPWVSLDMTMARLAQDNEDLTFTVNIRYPTLDKVKQTTLTDPDWGHSRLRESRMEEVRPHALRVFVGPHWDALAGFGGELCNTRPRFRTALA